MAPNFAKTSCFSDRAAALSESVTHGTKALADSLNASRQSRPVIDLGIGALDLPADPRISAAIGKVARHDPCLLHAFAPVRGHVFLREAISARLNRLHNLKVDPATEILVTPGGIKGALTVVFQTFLDPGDEVIVPVPNWPHYMDMIRLHGGIPRPALPSGPLRGGLTSADLEAQLDEFPRLLILGDCINPTGKVYSSSEIEVISRVLARHNASCFEAGQPGTKLVLDCAYEAHIPPPRPPSLAAIEVDLPSGRQRIRDCTLYVSGPGKTYGMHGDRLGYLIAPASTIDVASRVQANTNSFASVYAQIACFRAMQEDMDSVAERRALAARHTLETTAGRLTRINGLALEVPDGGYFLFVDFSAATDRYAASDHDSAASFLLEEAGIATIDGRLFAEGVPNMEHFVRINCGRSPDVLDEACARIERALQDPKA